MTTRSKQAALAKAKKEAEVNAEPVPETPPVDAAAAEPAPETPPVDAQAIEPSVATETPSNEVSGDGTGKPLPPIEETPGVLVRTKRRIKSRRRAGYRISREGVAIALNRLTDAQLAQLRDDPALEVKDCTMPIEGISEQEA